MKVSEKFTTENLFDEINKIRQFPFISLFSADKMNLFYINTYGDRTLSKMGRNLTVPEIANILVNLYGEKWDKIYESILVDFPILENYVETVTEKTNETGNSTNNTTETNVEKVSAYNDNDFVNDEQSTNTNEMKMNNENVIEKTYEKRITENATKNLENALNYLQNNVIYYIIFSDVNGAITLNIFD